MLSEFISLCLITPESLLLNHEKSQFFIFLLYKHYISATDKLLLLLFLYECVIALINRSNNYMTFHHKRKGEIGRG
jgi:hypothetical protein